MNKLTQSLANAVTPRFHYAWVVVGVTALASNDSGSDSGSSSDLADLSNFDVDDGGGYDDTLV